MRLVAQISSIIVALLFVYAINFKSFVTFDYFVNQSEIIELFCINKEKPQLQCDGKCHLASQFDEIEEDNDLPFSQTTLTYSLEINPLLDCSLAVFKPATLNLNISEQQYFNATLNDGYTVIISPPPKV